MAPAGRCVQEVVNRQDSPVAQVAGQDILEMGEVRPKDLGEPGEQVEEQVGVVSRLEMVFSLQKISRPVRQPQHHR